jgi:hypothetical protein
MRNNKNSWGLLAFVIGLLSISTTRAEAQYSFTQGTITGTRKAASQALAGGNNCGGRLSENRLMAIMLSIPVWEVGGGSRTYNPSPMALARGDTWARTLNRRLFSFGTQGDDTAVAGDDRRAHWNPGVGLWQQDTNDSAKALNQAVRMHTEKGGVGVARYLRDGYCTSTAELQRRLNQIWNACSTDAAPNRCYDTYSGVGGLYIPARAGVPDSLNITQTAGSSENGGGVLETWCRFGTGVEFKCYWVDTSDRQGSMNVTSPSGVINAAGTGYTPLAAPFLAFNYGGNKWMAWLQTSGVGGKVIRFVREADSDPRSLPPVVAPAVPTNTWSRTVNLEVNTCSGNARCWSALGL